MAIAILSAILFSETQVCKFFKIRGLPQLSHFAILFKLESDQKTFLKCKTLPTLLGKVWQSMASVAMYEFGLKSKEYLPYLKIKCGNPK